MGLMDNAVPPLSGEAGAVVALELAECVDPEPPPPRCRLRPTRPDPVFEKDDLRLSSPLPCGTSPRHRIRSSTLPPAGVNFKLLLTKLMMTCRIPLIHVGPVGACARLSRLGAEKGRCEGNLALADLFIENR